MNTLGHTAARATASTLIDVIDKRSEKTEKRKWLN